MSEPRLRKLGSATAGLAMLFLASCYGGPENEPGPAVTTPVVALGQAGYNTFPSETYLLRPNDVISVSVFREADLSLGSIPVSATGEISLPLLGPMTVTGMTASQLETMLETQLNQYLRYPEVTVNIVQYGSHMVTVEGSVASPGMYNFSPGTRLSGAVAMSNGLTRAADQDDVAVFRQTPDGIAIAKFDYLAIQSGTMMDPVLEPGDRVVVGLNNLSQFWQDVIQTLPFVGLFRRF